jgi:acyl transferase domain-containing protein
MPGIRCPHAREAETSLAEKTVTPFAVIGMACRLPGGVDSPEQLWEALLRGEDYVTKVPSDRWDADEYYDPEPGVPGRSVSKWGAFLEDVAGFDAEFFGINDREATAIDPQHRLLMETSWEAVEHAGLDPAALSDSSTGVCVGLTHTDYSHTVAGRAIRVHRYQLQSGIGPDRVHPWPTRARLHGRLCVLVGSARGAPGLSQPA